VKVAAYGLVRALAYKCGTISGYESLRRVGEFSSPDRGSSRKPLDIPCPAASLTWPIY
jgi:hypothetical protein